jgi:hypothetical protein
MTDSAAAAAMAPAPKTRPGLSESDGARLEKLRAARSRHAICINCERQIAKRWPMPRPMPTLARYRGRQRAYLEHRDLDEAGVDPPRARAAAAALRELKTRMRLPLARPASRSLQTPSTSSACRSTHHLFGPLVVNSRY